MKGALQPGASIGFAQLVKYIEIISVTSTTITVRRDCAFFPSGSTRARAGISPLVPLSTRLNFSCIGPDDDYVLINLQPATQYWVWFTGAPTPNLTKTSGIIRATTSP